MKMIELFNEIWEERQHVSSISGHPLFNKGHFLWHNQFSHTLPKSIYKRYAKEKFNIVLMLPSEHKFYEHFTEKDKLNPLYLDHQPQWDALFELADILSQRYHREKRNSIL